MKIPTYAKGAIIGKHGSKIRLIQNKTNTKLTFEEKETSKTEVPNAEVPKVYAYKKTEVTYEELSIKGSAASVLEAEKMIQEIINNLQRITEDIIVIHDQFVGRLIGSSGHNINRLKETYKVSVELDKYTIGEIRVVTIRGITANIDKCKRDIIGMIDECKAQNSKKDESFILPYLLIGDVIAGYHDQTLTWQRCEITNVKRDSVDSPIMVNFLDMREHGTLSMSKLRQLNNQIITLPLFHAFR